MIKKQKLLLLSGLLLILTLSLASLSIGNVFIKPWDIFKILSGGGNNLEEFIIFDLRLPRLLVAIFVGSSLAIAGSLFQISLNNSLASPDILGISSAASSAAVGAALFLGVNQFGIIFAAFLGAITAAVINFSLSWHKGFSGYRFIVLGISINFVASSVTNYFLTRKDINEANQALLWLVGSLASSSWEQVFILTFTITPLIIATLFISKSLGFLALGDIIAANLGIRVNILKFSSLTLGTLLAAVAVSVAGPVAFVALLVAPIVRRIVGNSEVNIFFNIIFGSCYILSADLLAQNLPYGNQFPVGVITGLVGGIILFMLLLLKKNEGKL